MACYATNLTMAVIANLSPLLFLTFRDAYGVSFTALGLLVLVNFVTQLAVDLVFSFFSQKFNIALTVKLTPVIAVLGLLLFAAAPLLFPQRVYLGLLLGTVIFSAASGLAEVLISPVIAAIPSDNPARAMSALHAIYAWGSVGVVLISTLFLHLAGRDAWQILTLILTLLPLAAALLYFGAEIPPMETPARVSGAVAFLRRPVLWLMVAAIFLGGAAECTMAQWCSGYIEGALGIPKIWGDILGVACFSLALALGRSLFAGRGESVTRVMVFGAVGASATYLLAALINHPVVGLLACAATGFFVAMFWPGSLIVAAKRVPAGGVFLYAMMAAGGDLGASVGPQLVGVISDAVALSPRAIALAAEWGLAAEQLGMKCGMLLGALFPLLALPLYLYLHISQKRGAQNAQKD